MTTEMKMKCSTAMKWHEFDFAAIKREVAADCSPSQLVVVSTAIANLRALSVDAWLVQRVADEFPSLYARTMRAARRCNSHHLAERFALKHPIVAEAFCKAVKIHRSQKAHHGKSVPDDALLALTRTQVGISLRNLNSIENLAKIQTAFPETSIRKISIACVSGILRWDDAAALLTCSELYDAFRLAVPD